MPKLMHFFCFALLLCCNSYGQVQVTINGRKMSTAAAGIQYCFSDSGIYNAAFARQMLQKKWQPFTPIVRISYQPQIVWLKIPLNRLEGSTQPKILSIVNPHINELKLWVLRNGTLIDMFPLTGDHHSFFSRPLPSTEFAFPISTVTLPSDTLLLAIDKRSSKLDIPLHFYQQAVFWATQQKKYLLKGLVVGLLSLLIFFNMLLFSSSKERVYLWYGFYLITILAYYLADAGLLFQFLYPLQPQLNDLTRPFAFASSTIPLVLFFNSLINIRKHSTRLYKLNQLLIIVYLLFFFTALTTSMLGQHTLHGAWLKVNAVLSPTVLLIVLSEAVYLVKQGVRFAWFALLSFSMFTIAIIIFVLGQHSLIQETNFVLQSHYVGISIDCIIVAWSLVWRYYSFRKDAARLQADYLQQQQEIFTETSAWQKEEMQRFSSLLHDHVGAHLGFLRLKLDKMPLDEDGRKELAGLITSLGNEVRYMSHQFSPLQLQDKGLYGAVEEMVQHIRTNSSIALQFEWIGCRERLELQYELLVYRVLQELFQNLLKHSHATEAILQIMHEKELFGIYLEDNGVGMAEVGSATTGIGLKSIEQLIKLLKGRFLVATAHEQGYSISIEFSILTK